jgi:hypothetical protein
VDHVRVRPDAGLHAADQPVGHRERRPDGQLGPHAHFVQVLHRVEVEGQSLGDPAASHHRHQTGGHGHGAVSKSHGENPAVAGVERRQAALEEPEDRAGLASHTEQPAGQHGGQGQRHQGRHADRHGDGHAELIEVAAHRALHEHDGDEDRAHGQGRGHHCQTHLAGAPSCGAQGRLAGFEAPRDALEHDDGIIDHQTDGQGEGDQGHCVQGQV